MDTNYGDYNYCLIEPQVHLSGPVFILSLSINKT